MKFTLLEVQHDIAETVRNLNIKQCIILGACFLLGHFSFRKRFEQQQKLLEEERKRRQFEEQKQKLRLLSSVKPKVILQYFSSPRTYTP